ncbi:MAG: sigma-70 family RNA polymerase sigma factor [Actinomycetota bacterium]
MSGAADEDLVHRFLAGDAGAFTELVTRHERRVYGLCLRILGDREDAADAAQDAFLVVVRKLEQFRGESAFTTWLHRVTVNVCYDHLRKAQRRPVLRRIGDEQPEPESGPPVPDHADDVAGAHDVAAALALVPEDFRVALVLADVQDLPYDQIARVLDVPVGTVKSRVHRGRIALARAMGLDSDARTGEPVDPPRTSQEQS